MAARCGSLKKMLPHTVAAITPVTRKSYCSITEPTMLASATRYIWRLVGIAAASVMTPLDAGIGGLPIPAGPSDSEQSRGAHGFTRPCQPGTLRNLYAAPYPPRRAGA